MSKFALIQSTASCCWHAWGNFHEIAHRLKSSWKPSRTTLCTPMDWWTCPRPSRISSSPQSELSSSTATPPSRPYPRYVYLFVCVPRLCTSIKSNTLSASCRVGTWWYPLIRQIFKPLLEPIIEPETLRPHPVTELYQVCQKRNLKLRFVDLWEESTAFHVYVDGRLAGRGMYQLKKEIAINRAAKDALNNLERILGDQTRVGSIEEDHHAVDDHSQPTPSPPRWSQSPSVFPSHSNSFRFLIEMRWLHQPRDICRLMDRLPHNIRRRKPEKKKLYARCTNEHGPRLVG